MRFRKGHLEREIMVLRYDRSGVDCECVCVCVGGVINGRGLGLCSLDVWVPVPLLPLMNSAILGKTFNLLEYQFPHL